MSAPGTKQTLRTWLPLTKQPHHAFTLARPLLPEEYASLPKFTVYSARSRQRMRLAGMPFRRTIVAARCNGCCIRGHTVMQQLNRVMLDTGETVIYPAD